MNFEPEHPTHGGQPNGVKRVLAERGLWRDGLRYSCKTSKEKEKRTCSPSNDCYAVALLSSQADFLEQKTLVEEFLTSEGQDILLLPKFQPEINWIEQFWSCIKRYTREHTTGSIAGLRKNIPDDGKFFDVDFGISAQEFCYTRYRGHGVDGQRANNTQALREV